MQYFSDIYFTKVSAWAYDNVHVTYYRPISRGAATSVDENQGARKIGAMYGVRLVRGLVVRLIFLMAVDIGIPLGDPVHEYLGVRIAAGGYARGDTAHLDAFQLAVVLS
ncbi:hypothetical protein CJV21_24640 [Salmonella enterica subsp. enterica serovar Rubislaw]|nr:hypothetical protein [Salmonella enterica subsp. enterica serovar Rubislaw]